MGVLTSIKPIVKGTDYFMRPYSTSQDVGFKEMIGTETQSFKHSNVAMSHSEFSKPYLVEDYNDMEYVFKPPDGPPPWEPPELPDLGEFKDYVLYETYGGGTWTYGFDVSSPPIYSPRLSWQELRDLLAANNGTFLGPNGEDSVYIDVWNKVGGIINYCDRGFMEFELNNVTGNKVISAYFKTYGYDIEGSINTIVYVQEGTWSRPVDDYDYTSFIGDYFAQIPVPFEGFVEVDFNQTGLDYLTRVIGGTAKLFFRNEYDFLNIVPPENVAYSAWFGHDDVFRSGSVTTELHITTI